jgi:hypothetical protein
MNRTLMQTIQDTYRIAPMGLAVLVLYLVGEWFKFHFPLEPQKRFLIDFSILLGDACLLHAITIKYLSGILRKKRGEFSNFESIFHGVRTVPKVLLSYMGLMLFTQLSLDIFQSSPLPIFFILIFFIWAPYICSFEFFARTVSEQEIEEEDSLLESLDESNYHDIRKRLVTRKSWWQLGYLRSIEFTTSKGSFALSIIFLIWLVRIIPELLIDLSFDPNTSFTSSAIQVVLSWMTGMFVHLTIIKTILFSLQPEQREELESDTKLESPSDMFGNPVGIRVSILCILVLFTTMLWSERRFQSDTFPEFAVRSLVDVQFSDEELVLEVEIIDPDQKLRWLSPSRFRLLESSPEEVKKREEKKKERRADKKADAPDPFEVLISMMNETLVPPNRFVLYDKDRNLIPAHQLSPRDEGTVVVLAFPIRRHADKDIEPLYEVSYVNAFGYKEILFTFKKKGYVSERNP